MNHLQEQMRRRWDEKGWDYDHSHAHGVHSDNEKSQWKARFQAHSEKALEVLDVGTGTGFVALLAAELGHQVTAIDWSRTMLAQAKSKAESESLEIEFIEGMTESLPFENDRFDVLTARHLLWTLSDPDQALSEWFRVIKPGGTVWADYTPRNEEHAGHHYSDEVENQLPLNKNISQETVEALFRNAGFIDVRAERLDRGPEHHGHRTTYLFSGVKPSR